MTYLAPNWTAGPTGKDSYRPWVPAVLDGLSYFANGWDNAWRWDPTSASSFYDIGAAAPTTFAVNDDAGGSTFPAGTEVRYMLVFRNSSLAKESAPQRSTLATGETVAYVAHTMAGTKDVVITWTDPGGEFDKVGIYRALQSSDTFHKVAYVTASTATYTDSSTDATIRTNTAISQRYRGTKPPVPEGIASHNNRLWLWEPDSSNALYSQLVDPVYGELLQEDFPDENILPIGPEASCGFMRALWSRDGSGYFFKDSGVWELAGEDPFTFEMRQAVNDRGCLNQRCWVEVNGEGFILDRQGLWRWLPGSVPMVCGRRDKRPDPMRSVWKRMYLGVRKRFQVVHREETEEILVYLCLDYEPTPNVRLRYDYIRDRFTSMDTMVWSGSSGILTDANGAQHPIRVDDRGVVWEDEQGATEGAYDGTLEATLTSTSGFDLVASAATFDADTVDGARGSPFRRYTSAGVLIEENRVEAAASTNLTPYYYSTTAGAAGQTVKIGVIPGLVVMPVFTADSPREKGVRKVVFDHDQEASASYTLDVQTSANGVAMATKTTLDLSADVRSVALIEDFAWDWQLQFGQDGAGLGFTVRNLSYYVRMLGDRK